MAVTVKDASKKKKCKRNVTWHPDKHFRGPSDLVGFFSRDLC